MYSLSKVIVCSFLMLHFHIVITCPSLGITSIFMRISLHYLKSHDIVKYLSFEIIAHTLSWEFWYLLYFIAYFFRLFFDKLHFFLTSLLIHHRETVSSCRRWRSHRAADKLSATSAWGSHLSPWDGLLEALHSIELI